MRIRLRANTSWIALLGFMLLGLAGGMAQTPSPSASVEPSPTESPAEPTPEPSPTPLPAPLNYHRWGSITTFNGLPSDSVRAMAQTPDGVMWFGTENGLARFDGRRIQKYTLGSAASDRILVISLSGSGSLWIGTGAGAFEYGEEGYRPVRGTEGVSVTSLLVGEVILLGTDRGTVLKAVRTEGGEINGEPFLSEPITDVDGKPVPITHLARLDGEIVATTRGRGAYRISGGVAREFVTSPRPLFINSVASGADRTSWFGSDAAAGQSGVYELGEGGRADRLSAATANVLAVESNDGGLWAGTERNGLFRFDGKEVTNFTFANTSGGLRSDFIFTLFTDREDVLWIGTNRGVSRFDRLGPFQETVSESPNGNFIRTLFRTSNGTLYAGSNRGLFVKSGEMWNRVPGYERSTVYALWEDQSDRLLVGTATRDSDTRSYAVFRNDRYAAVFGTGLVRLGTRGDSVIQPIATANALAVVGDQLWIGTTDGGLLKYDGQSVTPVIINGEFDCGAIWRILPGTDESVWIAAAKGVFRVTDGRPEKVINTEDVRDVYVRDADVWAATTTQGVIHARRDERFGWLAAALGFEQGLPSEKAFSILPNGERLLIASNRGVVTYLPRKIPPTLIATRILSQRVHDLRELRSTIALDHPQNSLVLEVAGQSSRTFPQEFQYGFLLKNESGEILERRLTYEPQYSPEGLKAGTYRIEAIAFDRDLNASEPLEVSFSIARAPFPWTATALAVLLAIALIALIWAVVERHRISLRNRELKQARFDLANEAERERGRIARDLHDQTLADLRNLMLRSDKLGILDPTFRDDIESVSKEVRRICEDLSPSVLENVGLIAALEFLLSHSVEDFSFDSSGAKDDNITFPTSVQLQIYRIAQEALSNIQKHSDAKSVAMRVTTPTAGSFRLTISDDGTPFTPDSDTKLDGRGIGGIRSRASLINALVGWQQKHPLGNEFSLAIDRVTTKV